MHYVEKWKELSGHTNFLQKLQFNHDSSLLASSSPEDCEVKIWEVVTGRLLHSISFAKHEQFEAFLTFSADSKMLAAGGGYYLDHDICVWEVKTGQLLLRLPQEIHTDFLSAMVFSPDSKILATSASELRLWDVKAGTELSVSDELFGLTAFSPDGNLVMSVHGPNVFSIWSIKTGQQYQSINSEFYGMLEAVFSPDSKLIATIGTAHRANQFNHAVSLWQVETGKLLQTYLSDNLLDSLCFDPNGTTLITTSTKRDKTSGKHSGFITFYDFAKQEIEELNVPVSTNAFNAERGILASANQGGTIELWKLNQF